MRFSNTLTLFIALLMSGCAAKLIPDDYKGPVANVADSTSNFVGGGFFKADKANFFFMSQADGKQIQSNLSRTDGSYSGSGLHFKPIAHERKVPAKTMQVKLTGTTHYGAPIGALLGTNYHVSGTVSFAPKPGLRYVVRGRLGPSYSGVWIESSTGAVVTRKVEKKK